MKGILIGLVLSRRYQLVHTKRSGGQIGLLELNVTVVKSNAVDERDETYVVNLWGQQASDKCRHIIHNGSIIAVKVTQRRVSADQRVLLTGQLLTCTLPNSDDVEMMFANGLHQINKAELTSSMQKTISLVKLHPQWLLLRYLVHLFTNIDFLVDLCCCRSLLISARHVSSFQYMASETKAILFNITILIPIDAILQAIENQNMAIDVFDMQNERALLHFQFHDQLHAQLFASLPRPITDLQTLINQQTASSNGSVEGYSWLVPHASDGKWACKLRLQRVAVMHSYQHKIKSVHLFVNSVNYVL